MRGREDGDWLHGLRIDPTRTDSAEFLRALERLDTLAYAPHGLKTPRWALYDCAQLPGAVLGLCGDGDDLSEEALHALEHHDESSEQWWPLTFLMALPTLRSGAWLVHSICGLSEVVETAMPDLRAETMRLAYAWLGATRVRSICQWTGDRLPLHARWGPLVLEAAWLPSHDHPGTCVFHYHPEPAHAPAHTARDRFVFDPSDESALRALQAELEAGVRLQVIDVEDAAGPRRVFIERRRRAPEQP